MRGRTPRSPRARRSSPPARDPRAAPAGSSAAPPGGRPAGPCARPTPPWRPRRRTAASTASRPAGSAGTHHEPLAVHLHRSHQAGAPAPRTRAARPARAAARPRSGGPRRASARSGAAGRRAGWPGSSAIASSSRRPTSRPARAPSASSTGSATAVAGAEPSTRRLTVPSIAAIAHQVSAAIGDRAKGLTPVWRSRGRDTDCPGELRWRMPSAGTADMTGPEIALAGIAGADLIEQAPAAIIVTDRDGDDRDLEPPGRAAVRVRGRRGRRAHRRGARRRARRATSRESQRGGRRLAR